MVFLFGGLCIFSSLLSVARWLLRPMSLEPVWCALLMLLLRMFICRILLFICAVMVVCVVCVCLMMFVKALVMMKYVFVSMFVGSCFVVEVVHELLLCVVGGCEDARV